MLRFELVPITTTAPPPPPPESTPPPPPQLLHLSFNQSHTCFAAGTDRGYRIYNSDPFRRTFDRDLCGGVSIFEMLLRSHIWAFVGRSPPYSPNKVMIWNDLQSRCVGELLFRSQVRAVRIRFDRIVAVLEHKLKIHNLEDLRLVDEIETISNPKGLCAVSHQAGSMVLACPGLRMGQVRVVHYRSNRTIFVMAHESGIACFALSPDGKFLATASTKGTLIRVFSTIDGYLLQEVRRGKDKADIYSLAFAPNGRWLAVSSDKGTVHVFRLKYDKSRSTSETDTGATLSSLSVSFFRGMLPKYFSSEWSLAKFHLHEGSKYIVAFGPQKNTVLILGMDGSFYRCRFDPVTGGEMIQLEHHNIFKP